MPKATSKTFKKKKYNARFPPARIKKIMQTDEDVGKVAAAVPVIISRALEMFIESLILKTAKTTQAKNAKTLSTSHIKQTINGEKQFDFLRDLVKNVPDHQTEDNNGDATVENEPSIKKGRGRPRKSTESQKAGKRSKSCQAKASSDTSEEEEEDEEEYDIDDEEEDTETDEETPKAALSTSTTSANRMLPGQPIESANNGAGFYQPSFSGTVLVPSVAPIVPILPSQEMRIIPPYPPPLLPVPAISPIIPPPRHFLPQFPVPLQEPINLSNPCRPPALGTKEDDDYDS